MWRGSLQIIIAPKVAAPAWLLKRSAIPRTTPLLMLWPRRREPKPSVPTKWTRRRCKPSKLQPSHSQRAHSRLVMPCLFAPRSLVVASGSSRSRSRLSSRSKCSHLTSSPGERERWRKMRSAHLQNCLPRNNQKLSSRAPLPKPTLRRGPSWRCPSQGPVPRPRHQLQPHL